jgi:type I restriction enzyme R subunit
VTVSTFKGLLLDTYIQAEDSEVISSFDNLGLVELIVEQGPDALDRLPKGIRGDQEAVAETIENNLRRLIIDEQPVNPKYFEKMSELLDALIRERKEHALAYKAYLEGLIELTRKVKRPETQSSYPPGINSPARRALYDNLKDVDGLAEHMPAKDWVADVGDIAEQVALAVDDAIRYVKKDGWRDNRFKRIEVRNAIKSVLGDNNELVDSISYWMPSACSNVINDLRR